MKWENLLSLKRQGDSLKRLRSEQDNTRVGVSGTFCIKDITNALINPFNVLGLLPDT